MTTTEASNGREVIQQFRRHRPDITLMDLQTPAMNGFEAMIGIRKEFPEAKIIMLTTYDSDGPCEPASSDFPRENLVGFELRTSRPNPLSCLGFRTGGTVDWWSHTAREWYVAYRKLAAGVFGRSGVPPVLRIDPPNPLDSCRRPWAGAHFSVILAAGERRLLVLQIADGFFKTLLISYCQKLAPVAVWVYGVPGIRPSGRSAMSFE